MYHIISYIHLISINVQENPELLQKEEQRKKRWQEFLEQQSEKLVSEDNIIKEKEAELRKHYKQLKL